MMAVLVQNTNGHLQSQLTRSLERILEEANQSGELRLSNRKLKDFPKCSDKYNLSDTVIADLSKNRFSELPEEVTSFHFLEKLLCYHNAIRFMPDGLSNLQCLSFLDLSRNQLTSLPREICQLPIQILLVSNNRLKSLPDELSKMSQLTELDASCNQLSHLPPRMCELRSLQSLILRNNLLLALPIDITLLSLVRLDLRANRLSTLPVELRDMESMIDLLLEDNPFTSPPASLCKRGRVHIFKYLETEALRLEAKCGNFTAGGTLGRRTKKTGGSPGPTHLDRLKQKRYNVDSGYSTSSDDKRWSQEITGDLDKTWTGSNPSVTSTRTELNGTPSSLSTPSTISPGPENGEDESDRKDDNKSLGEVREYKEALKQQRAQEVPSVYRTKESDEHSYKTEPNTPTHYHSPQSSMATSKSDPTPLNSVLGSPKKIFDDTSKKPVQKVQPSRNTTFSPNHSYTNGNGINVEHNRTSNSSSPQFIQDYVKPTSPFKTNSPSILSHDNVPSGNNKQNGNSPLKNNLNGCGNVKSLNGVNKATPRNISWNPEVAPDKMTFTMRREIDKAREETDLINQLRNIIETRLKMALPNDLASSLTDGVVLCHLANHIKPRSVASIHVPSPAVPKLTMARCRRNVDNFIEACRKIGVDEGRLCSTLDVTEALEGRGLPCLYDTIVALCEQEQTYAERKQPAQQNRTLQDTTVSLLLLAVFFGTLVFLMIFPPPP
ncbi:leucine-rich repeat and calponin homology domain-containing protein isoform X2 [Coccinella septempunctata]|uniref:leucine-rich repeat and calponin homology domain-containing protein isoform X2 n=1 Tax=Coccinella septempunctata TaxID=41139 RepID=UPI001D097074|nr:leucine-rich repeat and calponin homology domain-containing protein isoform X2 [Coccinella septempunctata]